MKTEALIESKSLRDEFANRTEILNKVKALVLLPDDINASVEIVTNYYGVSVKTLEALIQDHREELESDGLRILRGNELTYFKQVGSISKNAATLTAIPRRALLRIGMLLRNSEVAKQVRTYLLDAEAEAKKMDWVKIAKQVDAVTKLYRTAGKPKPEAFTLALQTVQKQTSWDLTRFMPEPQPVQDVVDHAIRNGAIRANPQASIPRLDLHLFFGSYASAHHMEMIAPNKLITRLIEAGIPLVAKKLGSNTHQRKVWFGCEVIDSGSIHLL